MLKKIFKLNSHNGLLKALAGFGRSMNRLYENRNHNPETNGEVTILKKISKYNPKVIIDGGANIGNYALLINKFCPLSEVYCFEPVKETYQRLTGNLRGKANIKPLNKGLYVENTSKEINIFQSDEHASIYNINNAKPTEKSVIDLVKGDSFLAEHGIEDVFFAKLDLEGAEYDAIQGFEQAIRNRRIRLIQFEYGYVNISAKRLLIDFHELLESYDFIVGKVYPKTVEFRKYQFKHEDFLGPNFVAVHKDDKELINTLSSNKL